MGAIICSPDRFSKTNGWSNIYGKIVHGKCSPFAKVMHMSDLKKITGFPLNNFCVNHEVKGFFLNLKYAHKFIVLICQIQILKNHHLSLNLLVIRHSADQDFMTPWKIDNRCNSFLYSEWLGPKGLSGKSFKAILREPWGPTEYHPCIFAMHSIW